MEPQLLLGSAKMDITPPHPVPLAGFAHRAGSFETVAQPLYARIHCFGQSGREERNTGALFVSADLIWWGTDLVRRLRPKLQERFGFETVLLHATHTHSGPQTSGSLADSLGLKDEAYLAYLEERLTEGIERALADKEPVTVEKGGEICQIGVNRRLEAGGAIVMAPNEAGPVDPEVTVIRFRKRAGERKPCSFIILATRRQRTTTRYPQSSRAPRWTGSSMRWEEKR